MFCDSLSVGSAILFWPQGNNEMFDTRHPEFHKLLLTKAGAYSAKLIVLIAATHDKKI